MAYDDLDFRGRHILQERQRVDKERLVAASFNAWQMLSSQVKEPVSWRKYIKGLGLLEEVQSTKEELKREADQAMRNVENILAKARKGENGGR